MQQRFRLQTIDPNDGFVTTRPEEFESFDAVVTFIASQYSSPDRELGRGGELDLEDEIEADLEKDNEHFDGVRTWRLFEVPAEPGRAVRLTREEWDHLTRLLSDAYDRDSHVDDYEGAQELLRKIREQV